MTDEDWILDVQLNQKIRQREQCFVVHVGHGARLAEKIGVAGTIARVDGHRTSRGPGDALGEGFPLRDRAQAFMKKDEFQCIRDAAGNALHFEVPPLDGCMECFLLVRDSVLHFDDIGRLHEFFSSKTLEVLFRLLRQRSFCIEHPRYRKL